MLITEITIKNFQAHDKLTVRMDQFTIVAGKSSAGKSSIMRALDWLFYGDWDKTYPFDPKVETAVGVRMTDGTVIARFRKGTKNRAAIKYPDGSVKPWKDFGDFVPGIFELLNVKPIKVAARTVNLNMSRQDEPIFMLSDQWTKPTKAQWIGRLYGAHLLNSMLRLMSSDKNESAKDRRRQADEVKRLYGQLKEYSDTEDRENALSHAAKGIGDLKVLRDCGDRMQVIMREVEVLRARGPLLGSDLELLRQRVESLEALQSARFELSALNVDRRTIEDKKAVLGLDTGQIRGNLELLEELRESAVELQESSDELNETIRIAALRKKELTKLNTHLKTTTFKAGKCPLCLSKPKKLKSSEIAGRLTALIGG